MARKRRTQPGPYLSHLDILWDRVPNREVYPYSLPALRHLERLALHPKVTFFVGENGSGKSTLLEAIAVDLGMNPEGGSRNFNFATRASHSSLHEHIRLVKTIAHPDDLFFLRAESYFNVATEVERLERIKPGLLHSYGGSSLHEQSHGESFFALFQNRFRDHGLFLLDEPEAALSPKRQVQFLSLLHQLLVAGGQFVIATHSPIILAYPESRIFVFSSEGIHETPYT